MVPTVGPQLLGNNGTVALRAAIKDPLRYAVEPKVDGVRGLVVFGPDGLETRNRHGVRRGWLRGDRGPGGLGRPAWPGTRISGPGGLDRSGRPGGSGRTTLLVRSARMASTFRPIGHDPGEERLSSRAAGGHLLPSADVGATRDEGLGPS